MSFYMTQDMGIRVWPRIPVNPTFTFSFGNWNLIPFLTESYQNPFPPHPSTCHLTTLTLHLFTQ